MGYIKKLKNNELVGGTDKTTIYPVTSTKAVFEEVTEGDKSSFKSQETINGEHDDRIKGLENEMPDTVKSITINGGTKTYLPEDGNVELTIYSEGGEDYPAISELVEQNAANIENIQNEIGTDTTEDTLSGRIKSLENAVGTGGSVDQRISNAIDNINAEHSDIDPTDHIQYQIIQSNGEITDLTIQGVDIASADALEALRQTYEGLSRTDIIIQNTIPTTGNEGVIYRVTGETTYTDYMFYNGQRYTMATYDIGNLDPQISYYACATPAATPAKAATGTDASAYALTLGGHFKVEMDEANTATSGVTLQVGSAAAKELMYNGATVDADNTWEDGEVIAVYYYNNKYWASNAQGGGGKAEKIKYDNSQSGLAADNVQGALDEVAVDIQEETAYNLNNYQTRNGSLTVSNGWNWDSSNQRGKHKAIPVTEGEILHVTVQTVGADYGNYCGWLTSDYVEGNQQSHNPIPYVSGTNRFLVDDSVLRVPEDAAWLCITVLDGGGYTANNTVAKVTKLKDVVENDHAELSNCHDGSKIKSSQSKTVVWTSADFANTVPGYGTNAKRVLLKPASMLDVRDVYKIVLSVPYSAVEEAQVDWCMICCYNNGKAVLSDLSTPAFYFEGSDASIEIDLSEDKYVGIDYLSPYFGSDSNIDIASIDWTAISVTAYKYVTENARAVAEYTEVVNISDYPYVNCIIKSGSTTSHGKTTNTGYNVWENNNTTGYGKWGKFVPIEAGATYRIKGGPSDTTYAFTINDEHTEGRVKNFAGEEQTYIALSANEERLIVAPYNAAYLYFTVRSNTEGYPMELSSMFKVSPRVDEDVTRIDTDLYKTYGWYTDISLWEMGSYNINTGVKQIYAENATLYIMTKSRIVGTPKFRSTNPKIKLMLVAWDGDTWLGAWNGSEFSSVSVDIEKMCFSEIDIADFRDYGYSFALQLRYMDQVYIPLSYSNYVQIFSESVSAVSDLMEFKDTLDDYIPPVVLMNADKESLIASLCNVTTPSASADIIDSDYFFAHDYLCFAHISDTHSWNKNVEHAVDIVNSGMFYDIDFLIHTGDIQRALYHDIKEAIYLWTDYVDTMKGSAKPALTCVGNHEHEKMDSISGFYDRYMKYMVDKEWLVEGTNIINGKSYWYKDFDKYKVRLIALDDFEAPYDSYYANKNYSNDVQLSPEQVEWFVDVLNSVPADYTVIIAMHAPCSDSSNSTKINPEWSTTNTQGVQPMHMSEHPIWDIVDAYQNKGTLSKTYTYTDNNVQTAWGNCVIDADFSSANGIFAFYIHGHNHVDYIYKFNAFPNQIHVAIAGGVGTKRWDDCGRSRYGKSYDSINVYVLNTDTHTVHIVKLGATMRRDGIERSHTSFTYYVPET